MAIKLRGSVGNLFDRQLISWASPSHSDVVMADRTTSYLHYAALISEACWHLVECQNFTEFCNHVSSLFWMDFPVISTSDKIFSVNQNVTDINFCLMKSLECGFISVYCFTFSCILCVSLLCNATSRPRAFTWYQSVTVSCVVCPPSSILRIRLAFWLLVQHIQTHRTEYLHLPVVRCSAQSSVQTHCRELSWLRIELSIR